MADGGLPCERETGNSTDPQAVPIKNAIDGVASNYMVPCRLLDMCQGKYLPFVWDSHEIY